MPRFRTRGLSEREKAIDASSILLCSDCLGLEANHKVSLFIPVPLPSLIGVCVSICVCVCVRSKGKINVRLALGSLKEE